MNFKGLRALDQALAETLSDDPIVQGLIAVTSYQVGRGHVCLSLDALASDPARLLDLDVEQLANWPPADPALWQAKLESSGLLGGPLVLMEGRLYLRRYYDYERTIARSIQSRLSPPALSADQIERLRQTLGRLFEANGLDYQRIACALALRSAFSVITGGPGTGKTTTVVKLLAALIELNETPLRICLAAPTGKAAARLSESIQGSVEGLPIDPAHRQRIPSAVTTLHRLLEYRPLQGRYGFYAQRTLPLDVLVIDEASMVDVGLMAATFEALPRHARILLLGDKDQLSSVEAGAVLGELCQGAQDGHYWPQTAQWVQSLTGDVLPEEFIDPHGSALNQSVAMLRVSYRFAGDSGIGALSESINQGALSPDWLNPIQAGRWADLTPIPASPRLTQDAGLKNLVLTEYQAYLSQVHRASNDSQRLQAIDAFQRFQILCSTRKGEWGADAVNQQIEAWLTEAGFIQPNAQFYAGQPIMVTRNDKNLGLFNGDVGLIFPVIDPDNDTGVLRVGFDQIGKLRWVSPARLRGNQTVYAMTVHKSQGSEFDHTMLILPRGANAHLTRELLYTAITRARQRFSFQVVDPKLWLEAARHPTSRASGLLVQLEET